MSPSNKEKPHSSLEYEADRTKADVDEPLRVEMSNGRTKKVGDWSVLYPETINQTKMYPVLFELETFKDFLKYPPTRVHIPVETATAQANGFEKSEIQGYAPATIWRYSKVVNDSNDPHHPRHECPYVEAWVKLEP